MLKLSRKWTKNNAIQDTAYPPRLCRKASVIRRVFYSSPAVLVETIESKVFLIANAVRSQLGNFDPHRLKDWKLG